MKISIIVAVAQNGVIGRNNALPWHLPADMKYFKEKTMGHIVIMGRKNYESIPEKFRPLPGRTNIVLTKNHDFKAPGAIVAHSMPEAIEKAKEANTQENEIFIIGGAEIYRFALETELADKLYVTHINKSFGGDIYFSLSELASGKWKMTEQDDRQPDERNLFPHSFCVYERVK